MQVTRGKIPGALKAVVYGPEGIGKSTFASQFPEPLFIDTEDSTKHLDVARLPKPGSWAMLTEEVRYVRDTPGICKTLVIDTLDWAEKLCIEDICAKNQKGGLESFGYGRGYVYLAEEFEKLVKLLDEVNGRGIHILGTAHAKIRKFEQPDESGAYDRWEMKLSKNVAPLVKEWCDALLFANYKTMVVNVDGQGSQKGKNKAVGGKRVMYTAHSPWRDAKNRHGLADELPFDYKEIAHVIEAAVPAAANGGNASEKEASEYGILRGFAPQNDNVKDAQNDTLKNDGEIKVTQDMPVFAVKSRAADGETQKALDELSELMAERKISDEEIRAAVHKRGYFPIDTDIAKYPLDFIRDVLIGAFEQTAEFIEADPERLPF